MFFLLSKQMDGVEKRSFGGFELKLSQDDDKIISLFDKIAALLHPNDIILSSSCESFKTLSSFWFLFQYNFFGLSSINSSEEACYFGKVLKPFPLGRCPSPNHIYTSSGSLKGSWKILA